MLHYISRSSTAARDFIYAFADTEVTGRASFENADVHAVLDNRKVRAALEQAYGRQFPEEFWWELRKLIWGYYARLCIERERRLDQEPWHLDAYERVAGIGRCTSSLLQTVEKIRAAGGGLVEAAANKEFARRLANLRRAYHRSAQMGLSVGVPSFIDAASFDASDGEGAEPPDGVLANISQVTSNGRSGAVQLAALARRLAEDVSRLKRHKARLRYRKETPPPTFYRLVRFWARRLGLPHGVTSDDKARSLPMLRLIVAAEKLIPDEVIGKRKTATTIGTYLRQRRERGRHPSAAAHGARIF